jgi:septation ring formation regulator EzrA
LEEAEQRCEQLEADLVQSRLMAPSPTNSGHQKNEPAAINQTNPKLLKNLEDKSYSLEEQLNKLTATNAIQEKSYHKACFDLEEMSYKLEQITSEKNHIERELNSLK